MQQVKLVDDRCDIAVIHKGNRGLVRTLGVVGNAGQSPEVTGNGCFDGDADLL